MAYRGCEQKSICRELIPNLICESHIKGWLNFQAILTQRLWKVEMFNQLGNITQIM